MLFNTFLLSFAGDELNKQMYFTIHLHLFLLVDIETCFCLLVKVLYFRHPCVTTYSLLQLLCA